MSKKIQSRVPEGTAIKDEETLSMEEYSDYMYSHRLKEYKNYVSALLQAVEIPINGRILEIGPGPAWITILLKQQRPDVEIMACEASVDMIRVARKNCKDEGLENAIKFIEGTVETLADHILGSFDLVYSNDSLHHWVDLQAAFLQIHDILAENGRIYIHDSRRDLPPMGKFILYGMGRLFAGKMWKYWKSSVRASYTKEEIDMILEEIRISSWGVSTSTMDLLISS